MQEPMVKFILILMALAALAFGGLLLVIPEWYVTFSDGDPTNMGWLRFIGAGIISLQGCGLAIVAVRRRGTNLLLGLIAFASTVQTGVLWYVFIRDELSVEAAWTVIVPGVGAAAGVVLLWAAWASRRASARVLASESAPVPLGEEGPPLPEQ